MISEVKNDRTDACEGKGGWSKAARFIGTILAILFAGFVGITALGYYWPDIQNYRYKMEAERFEKEINAERARILALEKVDTYGGKTPEETFDMFLSALNKSDAELASKYYDVTVQEEALAGLRKEMAEKGNLDLSIKYFTDVRGGEKKCNDIEENYGGCTFNYSYLTDKDFFDQSLGLLIEKGSSRSKAVDFSLIPANSLWKITQPY